MNNYFVGNTELREINSQIDRALIKKNKLKKIIYREYELYLKMVRELLLISIEKGIYTLCSCQFINDIKLEKISLHDLLRKRIYDLVNSQLPLITIEQLKIHHCNNKTNQEINTNVFNEITKLIRNRDIYFDFANEQIPQELNQEFIYKDTSSLYDYYDSLDSNQFTSINLDKNEQNNYYLRSQIVNKIDSESTTSKHSIEFKGEENFNELENKYDLNVKDADFFQTIQNTDSFEIVDDSLNNLLLNLSYKINEELFNLKLSDEIISEEAFKALANNKLFINHPSPFIIEFNFNENINFKKGLDIPRITFLNITTVELEFKNLILSNHRNKINDIKRQIKVLNKKERYWRQKEIFLNKILT